MAPTAIKKAGLFVIRIPLILFFRLHGRRDSNSRHLVLETSALPTELHPYKLLKRFSFLATANIVIHSKIPKQFYSSNSKSNLLRKKLLTKKQRKNPPKYFSGFICGERGIRTPGTSRYNGFQDRRIRPLCHLSERDKSRINFQIAKTFFKKKIEIDKKKS